STEKWNPGYEGTLTSLAYISSVATLWRFPEMILKHGGVFVIQYTLAYLAVGMPLLYAEIAIGQYTSCNHYGVFNHIAPILTGLGSCMTFILLIRSSVISVIQSTTLAFLLATTHGHQYEKGESTCTGVSHSPLCFNLKIVNECMAINGSDNLECLKLESVSLISGAVQLRRTPFFDHVLTEFNVLPQESSEFTWPHYLFFLSLLFVWILIAVICFIGMKALSKLSYLMVIPITVFIFFMIFGFATIPDASESLTAFKFHSVKLEWAKLENLHGIWTDAVSLVVFSLNLGNGGLVKIASHNDFGRIFTRDVNIISMYGYFFNYLTTLTILPYVYFISSSIYGNDAGRAMQMWVDHGDFGLMNVIAETLTSQHSNGWLCAMYFIACFILELESTSISMHVVYSSILDRMHPHSRSFSVRLATISLISVSAFSTSFFLIAPGGIYAIKQLDQFFTIATLFTSFVQICAFMHIYGFKRFIINVRTMTGGIGPVNIFWWISWIIFTPIVLLAAFIMECLYFSWDDISIGNIVLTIKLKNFSWIIFVSCILWFPSAAFCRFVKSYRKNEKKKKLLKSTPEWGPADKRSREDAKFNERAMRVR
ncbi:snf-10, partial [Pristionchus pacificus]